MGDKICCYGGAFDAVRANVWKNFSELSSVLVEKQGLSLKQQENIYQCCGRTVLLYCCDTWELTV